MSRQTHKTLWYVSCDRVEGGNPKVGKGTRNLRAVFFFF